MHQTNGATCQFVSGGLFLVPTRTQARRIGCSMANIGSEIGHDARKSTDWLTHLYRPACLLIPDCHATRTTLNVTLHHGLGEVGSR